MPVKKIVFFAILILSLFVINHLVNSIITLWQKKNLVVQAQLELESEKKENQKLKEKLAKAQKPQFIDEEARNKLFLVKPGESVVVIPTDYLHPTPSVTPQPQDKRQNWQKWWDEFF